MSVSSVGGKLMAQKVLDALADGFHVTFEDHGGYDGSSTYVEKCERFEVDRQLLVDMHKEGWIEPYGQWGYRLTDAGRQLAGGTGLPKLLFENAWLRQTIPNDPGDEPSAGG